MKIRCNSPVLLGFVVAFLSACGSNESVHEDESTAIAIDGFYRFIEAAAPERADAVTRAYIGFEFREVLSEESPGGERIAVSKYTSPLVRVPESARLDFAVGLAEVSSESATPVRFAVSVLENGDPTEVHTQTLDSASFAEEDSSEWIDTSLDLAAWSGKAVRFEFAADAGNGQAFWADPMIVTANAQEAERPNLILISLDTLRADHLGAYGYHRNTSPNLDRIFEDGFLFEECISPSSWTTPTHASLLTGMSPLLHGAGAFRGARLREEYTTLPELTRKTGHLTAAFTEGAAVGGQLGFYQGFSRYSNGKGARPQPPGEAALTFGEATRWLESYGHLPFTLFVHTYEIHWPYAAPADFDTNLVDDSVDPESLMANLSPDLMVLTTDPKEQQTLIDLYDSGIAYTDHVVGQFFAKLEQMGLLENSIVVLFSDHGEAFWEHGLATHGTMLYREVLHVPLYIHFPGRKGAGRVSQKVALEDVFPTIVDLMGLEFSAPGRAQSLLPLIDSESSGEYNRDRVLAQLVQEALGWILLSFETPEGKYIVTTDAKDNPHSPLDAIPFGDPEYKALSGEETLLRHLMDGGRDWWTVEGEARNAMLLSAREELFLYPGDVDEQHDVSLEKLDALAAIRAEFMDELKKMQPFVDEVAVTGEARPLTPEEIEELEALGYIVSPAGQ